jgi:DnaA regulatory inactivator Hda
MSSGRQLTLDLGHRPAMGRADFLVSDANRHAVAWIDRWPAWPGPAVAICGPPGSGKSHLAAAWRAASGAIGLAVEDLEVAGLQDRLAAARTCALDDAGAIAGHEVREEAALHLYNMIAERRGGLLLLDRLPPARWPLALPDLASRLRAAPSVAIEPPDDALIEGVLDKLFADRQLTVDAAVIGFLLRRMERSLDAARRVVDRIDEHALASKRPITVPLARAVLEDMEASTGKDP